MTFRSFALDLAPFEIIPKTRASILNQAGLRR